MKAAPLSDLYTIEPLTNAHDRRSFTCADPALDRYLREQAWQDARRDFAAVFVALRSSSAELHAFYSLSMASVSLTLLPADVARKMPRCPTVPAVRLGRLAVHVDVQGKGLGTHLLLDAMARSMKNEIAWSAFIVDAKDEKVRVRYERLGFRSFTDDQNHLYLMRKTIASLGLEQRDPV